MTQTPHMRLRELISAATHEEITNVPDVAEAIEEEANEIIDGLEEQYQALHAAATKLIEPRTYVMKPGETPWVMEPNALDELRAVLRGSNPAGEPAPWTTLHDGVLDHIDRKRGEDSSPATEPNFVVVDPVTRNVLGEFDVLHDAMSFVAETGDKSLQILDGSSPASEPEST